MKIFLDDVRNPPDHTWILVRDPLVFSHLARHADEISMDHDLGDGLPNGNDLLRKIEKEVANGTWTGKQVKFHIHSANPVGRQNMSATIASIYRMWARPVTDDAQT